MIARAFRDIWSLVMFSKFTRAHLYHEMHSLIRFSTRIDQIVSHEVEDNNSATLKTWLINAAIHRTKQLWN